MRITYSCCRVSSQLDILLIYKPSSLLMSSHHIESEDNSVVVTWKKFHKLRYISSNWSNQNTVCSRRRSSGRLGPTVLDCLTDLDPLLLLKKEPLSEFILISIFFISFSASHPNWRPLIHSSGLIHLIDAVWSASTNWTIFNRPCDQNSSGH